MKKGNTCRLDEELQTVKEMITLYCRKKEGHAALCTDCCALLEYAQQRLYRCKFGNNKPTCRLCPIHCYRPDMKEKMRNVMRYAGPRMIFHHPLMAIKHLLREYRNS